MNIQQLRQSLKMKWLSYYQQNRTWLVKMRIWGTYEGLRRPSSGFILATLSVLEPELDQILPFILDLNNNPDQIVAALGLNFNPEQELSLISSEYSAIANPIPQDFCSDNSFSENYVSSVAATTQAVDDEKPGLGFARKVKKEKVVSKTTVATRAISDRPAIGSRETLTKTLVCDKPRPGVSTVQKSVRSLLEPLPSGGLLTMDREIPRPTKTSPSLADHQVSGNTKNLLSLTVAVKIPNNGKPIKMQLKDSADKVKPSPPTNARSLPSWVDEFCQGRE